MQTPLVSQVASELFVTPRSAMTNFVYHPSARVVPRDLLPLPRVPDDGFVSLPFRGRRPAQRAERRRAVARGTDRIVGALNFLCGQGELPSWQRPSGAQFCVLQRLSETVRGNVPPSPPIDGQAALAELLATKASCYVEEREGFSCVPPYDPSLVSWPQSAGRARLVDCLPEQEKILVDRRK